MRMPRQLSDAGTRCVVVRHTVSFAHAHTHTHTPTFSLCVCVCVRARACMHVVRACLPDCMSVSHYSLADASCMHACPAH